MMKLMVTIFAAIRCESANSYGQKFERNTRMKKRTLRRNLGEYH